MDLISKLIIKEVKKMNNKFCEIFLFFIYFIKHPVSMTNYFGVGVVDNTLPEVK